MMALPLEGVGQGRGGEDDGRCNDGGVFNGINSTEFSHGFSSGEKAKKCWSVGSEGELVGHQLLINDLPARVGMGRSVPTARNGGRVTVEFGPRSLITASSGITKIGCEGTCLDSNILNNILPPVVNIKGRGLENSNILHRPPALEKGNNAIILTPPSISGRWNGFKTSTSVISNELFMCLSAHFEETYGLFLKRDLCTSKQDSKLACFGVPRPGSTWEDAIYYQPDVTQLALTILELRKHKVIYLLVVPNWKNHSWHRFLYEKATHAITFDVGDNATIYGVGESGERSNLMAFFWDNRFDNRPSEIVVLSLPLQSTNPECFSPLGKFYRCSRAVSSRKDHAPILI